MTNLHGHSVTYWTWLDSLASRLNIARNCESTCEVRGDTYKISVQFSLQRNDRQRSKIEKKPAVLEA